MSVGDPALFPLRAMRRGLAEMQTSIMAAALPLFGGRVDRFMVYTLIARRSVETDRPMPVLSIADSLRMPFETTRRHVGTLVELGLCRRDARGVGLAGDENEPPLAPLTVLAHDAMIRFVEDMAAAGALPAFAPSTRPYRWTHGWRAAADLMLATAETNRDTHRDRADLVLFSTILAGSERALSLDPALSRLYATIGQSPPRELLRPVRARFLTERLAIPPATVRRRIERLTQGPVRAVRDGLLIDEDWLATPHAIAASATTWGNVRRVLVALATNGLPFDDPARAYVAGRPPFVTLE